MGEDAGASFLLSKSNWDVFFYTWNERTFNGIPNYYGIFEYLPHILSLFLGSSFSAFIYYFILLSCSFLGCYLFIYKLLEQNEDKSKYIKIAAFLGTIFYFFNPISTVYRLGCTLIGGTVFYLIFPLIALLILLYSKHPVKLTLISLLLFIFFGFGFMDVFRWAIQLPFLIGFLLILKKISNKPLIKVLDVIKCSLLLFVAYLPIVILIFTTTFQQLNIASQMINPIDNLQFMKTVVYEWQAILLYPSYLWQGLDAYGEYYKNPCVIGCWLIIISSIYLPLILKRTIIKQKSYLWELYLASVSILILTIPLLALPKGPYGSIFETLFLKCKFLWVFRTTYDKFNTIPLFFATVSFSASLALLLNNKKMLFNKILNRTLLFTVIICMITVSLPALKGDIAYKPQTKFTPSENLFNDWKTLEEYAKNGKMFFVPCSYCIWIYSNFGYHGIDYLIWVIPGNHITYACRFNDLTKLIYDDLSNPNFDEKTCERINHTLHALGVKYIVLRKDLNLIQQAKQAPDGENILQSYKNFPKLVKYLNLRLVKKLNYYEIYELPDSSPVIDTISADNEMKLIHTTEGLFINLDNGYYMKIPQVLGSKGITIPVEKSKNYTLIL